MRLFVAWLAFIVLTSVAPAVLAEESLSGSKPNVILIITDEGGVRVPFFVRWDGHIKPDRDIDRIAAHIDTLPTLAALAGAEVPAKQVKGRDLLPLIANPQPEWAGRYLFTHQGRWRTGADPDDSQWKEFAVRNHIADDGETKEGTAAKDTIEFCDRIQYVGIAVREPEHHVWGCSPIKGEDGKYHLFGARFRNPFKTAWRSDSHVVHYVSDTPQGPFTFVEVVYRGERQQPGQWNYFGIHNPCIKKVDGKYALFFIANSYKDRSHRPGNQTIGMMIADSVNGPWSEPKQILTPSPDPKHWTYQAGTGVCNPAFVRMPNGKYHLYFKASGKETGMRYGVAIADKLEGPYISTDSPATENDELIEDGTAFIWNGKVCLLTTDNHGNVLKGGGAFWQSENGLKFGPPTLAYYHFDKYVSQEQYPRTHGVKGRRIKSYSKIVRPQILMEDGRPVWLYAPSGSCQKGREYSDCHVFRILTDEEVINSRDSEDKQEAE